MSQFINYGIDLGTTNSCIARLDGDELTIIQNSDQMNVTPSVVRVLKTGGVMVGRRAANATASDPDNVAAEFKRLMGQKYQKTFPASGRVLTPEELSAEVLKSLLADARRQTGEDVRASVITVPAAFTTLQCEATARAAQLAGLEEYPLLQEPIAAAVAYGARADARGQRWLVFDLGGGTLDVAVVSTRDGRLNVLEHRGDNHLGGKDVDRLVVQDIFLPFLREHFALAGADANASERLHRRLVSLAEYAKIELSATAETLVTFVDLGEDDEGTPLEAELTMTRAQLEAVVEPLLERCLQLAADALAGARVAGGDLDRVLLVGGPTQMPYIRRAVGERLGARVDHSLDPMTVVARGAVLYGSTVERRAAPQAAVADAPGRVAVRLAFEHVSESTQAPVAGKFDANGAGLVREVQAEAEGGIWASGWHAVADGYFELAVSLREGKTNAFRLAARDAAGRALSVEPAEFTIRHGLVVSAPPLPHTISVEVAAPGGGMELSPVFPRMTLLPAERTVSFRAARTLRPSEVETSLAVKLWEGEALSEPQANTWVGNMHIRSERVRRPIPEGAEIQLHIKVDASRLITVEAFVPHLNEHFAERVYIPREEEPDFTELLKSVPLDLESYLARLDKLDERLLLAGEGAGDEDFPEIIYDDGHVPTPGEDFAEPAATAGPREEVERLRREVEDLDIEISRLDPSQAETDHDLARGLVERAREIRVRVANLERRAGINLKSARIEEAGAVAADVEGDVEGFGSDAQKDRFAALYNEMKRSAARGDTRGVQKTLVAMRVLQRQVLYAQEWFWRDWLLHLQRPGRRFLNREEAEKWLGEGGKALEAGDKAKLEEAVKRLWELQPYEDQAAERERGVRPGLKS